MASGIKSLAAAEPTEERRLDRCPSLVETTAAQSEQIRRLVNEGGSAGELLTLILHVWGRRSELQTAEILETSTRRIVELRQSILARLDGVAERQQHHAEIASVANRIRGKHPDQYKCPACRHVTALTSADPLLCENCLTPLAPRVKQSARAKARAKRAHMLTRRAA